MEFDMSFEEKGFCTSKSWAKQKQSKKYNSGRDSHKATPNGSNLTSIACSYEYDEIKIKCDGGINPIEKYLNIQKPNKNDIESNLRNILLNTNPTMIKYEKANGRNGSYGNKNRWIVYYKYTPQQQYEQYYYNLQKEKQQKRLDKQYIKAKQLSNRKKNVHRLRGKHYKPPNITDKSLNFQRIDLEDNSQEFQYDLGKNKWINAISTSFSWNIKKKELYAIGLYKLLIAVDGNERDRRFYKVDDKSNNSDSKYQRNIKTKTKHKKYGNKKLNVRQKRKRERKQMIKERKDKKMNDKIKWEYIGLFDGSMNGYSWDKTKDFHIDKVHKINYTTYVNKNDNMSMKKHYIKNGKLCRWIKIIPCDHKFNIGRYFAPNIYGVDVDDYSQPIIPYKIDKLYKLNENIINGNEQFNICNNFIKEKGSNFQIGATIDDNDILDGKGCKVVIKKKSKEYKYGRLIDGSIQSDGYGKYYRDWRKNKIYKRYSRDLKKLSGERIGDVIHAYSMSIVGPVSVTPVLA